jgi:hypothetical protein
MVQVVMANLRKTGYRLKDSGPKRDLESRGKTAA